MQLNIKSEKGNYLPIAVQNEKYLYLVVFI